MKFIISDFGWEALEMLEYRGIVGLLYKNTLTGLLAYVIFGIICILSVIGLYTVIKTILIGRAKKKK